jgi:hypothetical protein
MSVSDWPKRGQSAPHSRELAALQIMTDAAQILDVVKREWAAENSWSDFDQGVCDRISAWQRDYYATFEGPYRYTKTSDGKDIAPGAWPTSPSDARSALSDKG